MCNIAGYAGSDRAAPILLDMIEAQQGLAGGYYTGLATIHEGVLHYEKVVGDTADLRKMTDAEALPGTIGIAHSRSKSGGDREWGQPFVGCDDKLAYLANGSRGWWEDKVDVDAMAAQIAADGHTLRALSDEKIGKYPVLPDGRCVHLSDVMCHAIGGELEKCGDPQQAVREAFTRWPGEIVGLYITTEAPDAIFGARFNMPACVGRDDTGSYVASSPVGFIEPLAWQTWVPPDTVFSIASQSLTFTPLRPPEQALDRDIDSAAGKEAIVQALSEQEDMSVGDLLKVVKPLSHRDNRFVAYDVVYQTLYDLQQAGRLEQKTVRREGAAGDLTAPQFQFRMV